MTTYTVHFKNGNQMVAHNVYHAINTIKKYTADVEMVRYERDEYQCGLRRIRPFGFCKVTPELLDHAVMCLKNTDASDYHK